MFETDHNYMVWSSVPEEAAYSGAGFVARQGRPENKNQGGQPTCAAQNISAHRRDYIEISLA